MTPAPVESKKRKRKQSIKASADDEPSTGARLELAGPNDSHVEHVPSVQAESSARSHEDDRAPDQDAEGLHISSSRGPANVSRGDAISDDETSQEPAAKKVKIAPLKEVHQSEARQKVLEPIPPPTEEVPAPGHTSAVIPLETVKSSELAAQEMKSVKRASRRPNACDPENIQASDVPRATSSRKKQGKEPEPRNIVIIGAGVIGMFIALELAKGAYASGEKQLITVVDINTRPCSLASGQCAGFLTVRNMPGSWLPLVDAAAPIWGDLIDSEEFRNAVGFRHEVFTPAETGNKRGHPTSWLNDALRKKVVHDEDSLGLLNSISLAMWLKNQCEGYGVVFRFNSHPTKVAQDRAGNITGVKIQSVDADAATAEALKCSHLVLAAGPFTKTLFHQLFPSSPAHLGNRVHTTEWLEIAHPSMVMEQEAGVMIPGPTAEDDAFVGDVGFVVDPSKQALKISCSRKPARASELKQRDALERRHTSAAALSEVADRHLNPAKAVIGDQSKIIAHGLAYVSTGPGRAPVIGRVRPQLLDPTSDSADGGTVWLCYGFGNLGTTVAPGVGAAVAENLYRGHPTIDLGDFAVLHKL